MAKYTKLKARKLKPGEMLKAAPTPEAKPQIPTMLNALRREREKARGLVDALEAKLGPVLRTACTPVGAAVEAVPDAAPVAQAISESVSIFALLNARLREITGRIEL
jgi:hypothetical protein